MHHWGLMKNLVQVKLKKGVQVLTLHVLTNGHINFAYLDFKSRVVRASSEPGHRVSTLNVRLAQGPAALSAAPASDSTIFSTEGGCCVTITS